MRGEDRREEIAERLGRYRTWGGPEMRALAEAVGAEPIAAVAVGVWRRHGWMVAATARELHLSRRPRVLGRKQQRSWKWSELQGLEAGPQRVSLTFAGGEEIHLQFLAPRREFDLLVDTARAATADAPLGTSVQELRELAKTKLGRVLAFSMDAAIDGLPARLDPDEQVQRLAVATMGFTGLLAVTDRRLLLVEATLRRGKDRVWELDRARIAAAHAEEEEEALRLELRDGDTAVLTDVTPPDRLAELAAVLS